ncbi:hypothetical protein FRACYDRAFT_250233 [Fragilariopsis cylindrus CCMP1102]|uniref:Uncharacterized protein n=1 Tax=Fragilariopsis cylindrus CCMP1102 TaxID=635003 RepID=A0A1E7ER39_9STRA|nr:hypothetical protein FRACYDRAFT_250233 [Fragilariopsis cylindrus CCMP1102]|eukprot:OEU08013.1 hypothetical protein FRACYDRAFT_250233 [Fragilariopsis cylindrus CCMP1102]
MAAADAAACSRAPSSYTVKTICIRSLTLRRIGGGGDSDDVINNNDITFCDGPGSVILTAVASIFLGTTPGRRKKAHRHHLRSSDKDDVTIASIEEGHAALSHTCVGDDFLCVGYVVTHINGVKMYPSYNSERCYDLITNNICYYHNDENDENNSNNGILSIQTGNDNGLDRIVLHATVIKPYPDATAKELGIEVWCGLRTYDALESINGISLSTYNNDKITKTNFDRIVQGLPCDITLVVRRRF